MAKLTKQQRRAIETAIGHLTRTRAFIARSDVEVVTLCSITNLLIHTYTRGDGWVYASIAKDIGSDLVGLEMGIETLTKLLAHEATK